MRAIQAALLTLLVLWMAYVAWALHQIADASRLTCAYVETLALRESTFRGWTGGQCESHMQIVVGEPPTPTNKAN
jgi:hypothetical protein